MDRAIHWFLYNKFNVDLVHTLRALSLVCPATAPLLNPTPASVHWPPQLRTFPFLNEDIIMDGLYQELPTYGIPCSCGLVFLSKLTAWKIWLPRKVESGRNRKRIDNLPIGQMQ